MVRLNAIGIDLDFPLELTRPLVIFDTETTGVHHQVDRILALALVKVYPDGKVTLWNQLFNPETPIPPEATAIHGITDEMVRDKPSFRSMAGKVSAGFMGCDYAGFNTQFDLRMLKAELVRAGIPMVAGLLDGRVIDAYRIFSLKFPRTLEAAVQEYLKEEHTGAHDAMADTIATLRVLCAQLVRHPELLVESVDALADTLANDEAPEPDGKTFWKFGEVCMAFGKHAGQPLRQLSKDYLKWLLAQDFPEPFKELVRQAQAGTLQRKSERP